MGGKRGIEFLRRLECGPYRARSVKLPRSALKLDVQQLQGVCVSGGRLLRQGQFGLHGGSL